MAVEVRYVGTRSRDSVADAQLQRVQHHRERVPRRVPAGAGESAREHRGRARRRRSPTPARPGHGAAADLPRVLQRPGAAQRRQRRALHRRQLDQRDVPRLPGERNPKPFGRRERARTGRLGNATLRRTPLTAGLPANFFVANPDLLGGANVMTNSGKTHYNSLQIELRRRYADGLQFQTSYVFGKGYAHRTARRSASRSVWIGATPAAEGDVTHALKANVDLRPAVRQRPAVRGQRRRRARSHHRRLADRHQRAPPERPPGRSRQRPPGRHGQNDVQNMFKLRFDDAASTVCMLPQDVIDNTILAFSVSATSATGYSGRADRPLLRAGERPGLHRDRSRR